MKKRLLIALAFLPAAFGAFTVTDRATFNRDRWLEDFEQLERAVEQSYANLNWSATEKQVDLETLHTRALADLQAAKSNGQARAALVTFLNGFKDNHLHIESGPPRPVAVLIDLWPAGGQPRIDFRMNGAEVCEALGFNSSKQFVRIDHPRLNEDKTAEFGAGTLTLANGRKLGVIRIPAFSQYDYGRSCERAWERFRSGRGGACDDDCQERFSIAAKHEVAGQLASDARRVARHTDGLVIDLTGNGGGTEWANYAAAALTRNALKPPPVAFVRGPHWTRRFDADIALLAGDSARPLPPRVRALVESNLALSRAMRDSARIRCDLSGIWTDRTAPACTNSVVLPRFATTSDRASVHGLASANLLLDDWSQLRQQQPFSGRIYIMVDEATASASEYFAAVLRDNNVATILGTKTMGVGCGYTNGGIDIRLPHSGLTVRTPDCARLRADGSNEFAGVTPDVTVDWGDSEASKGVALDKVLSARLSTREQ